MSFKTREKRRKKRAAVTAAQREARKSGSSSTRWYLTGVTRKTCCAHPSCHRILKIGDEMVYRKVPQASWCLPCAIDARVQYKPSVRWERARAQNPRGARRRRASRAPMAKLISHDVSRFPTIRLGQ